MGATSYGFGGFDYKARPDFTAQRDSKGAWSARNSFTMLREVWETYARELFVKGALLTDLDPELNSYWSFLTLESVEVGNEPGAITVARCTWAGWSETEYDEDEDVVYALSGTRVERPIQQHPLFRKEVVNNDDLRGIYKAILMGAIKGEFKINEGREKDPDVLYVISTTDASIEHPIENPTTIKWLEIILEQGIKTYQAPTLQWTEETSSATGWRDQNLNKLGLVEYDGNNRPPGSPPMPQYGTFNWLKISMNQTQEGTVVQQSQTWELSPPGGFQPAYLYDYDLSELEGEE